MKKKKLIIAAAAVIAVLGAAVFTLKNLTGGNSGAPGGAQGGKGGPGASQEVSYTVVKTENPHYGDVSVSSSLTGTVEASDVVHVYAKASGDVTAVNVIAGDYVEAGQVIMTIDTEQVSSAENQLESAEVSLNSAKSTLSRMQILYDGGDITQQEYEQYQDQYKSAQLNYESAKLNYDKQLSYSSITAPISGRVESVGVEVYDHVNNNAELAVISGEGDKRITTYVSERMVQHLSEGDEIEVEKNGKTYTGHLTEISTIVDTDTGLFKVKAELENTDEIATGSTVKIIMVTDRSENVMLVPVDAIYYSGGNAYVYVVNDNIASMKPVTVGLYDTENAEIKDGLTDDDNVVSTWSNNLYEGAEVRLYDDVYGDSTDIASADNAAAGNTDNGTANASDGNAADGENMHQGKPDDTAGGPADMQNGAAAADKTETVGEENGGEQPADTVQEQKAE